MADDPAKPQEELEEEEADLSHKDATNDYELPDSLPYACSIEYPGNVENVEKAIDHLGGPETVSQALTSRLQKPLALRFRPNDSHCQPVLSRLRDCHGLLLKCRPKRCTENKIDDEELVETEIVAAVSSVVEFTDLCDFQLLHPGLTTETCRREHYEIKGLLSKDHLTANVPLFLPPTSFSKYKPMQYRLEEEDPSSETSKKGFSLFHPLSIPLDHAGPVPDSHPSIAVIKNEEFISKLKKLFEEQPIWSKFALSYHLKQQVRQRHLALVSYHFLSGPWRLLYIRFGYDPRKSVEAKIYQGINVRFSTHSLQGRSEALLKFGDHQPGAEQETDQPLLEEDDSNTNSLAVIDERLHAFYSDRPPVKRRIMYQLCFIRDDAVQKLVHANDGFEPSEFSPTTGWYTNEDFEKIKKKMVEVTNTFKQHPHL